MSPAVIATNIIWLTTGVLIVVATVIYVVWTIRNYRR